MDRLYKILTDVWAIRGRDYESILAMLAASRSLAAEKLPDILTSNELRADVLCAATGKIVDESRLDDTDIPDNSVALIRLYGPLYSWHSDLLAMLIAQAETNPYIAGIVLDIDGPGGMATHIDRAVRAIKECSKPIATVVSGVMMSAHFWVGTSTQRTFMASPMCEIGCVGTILRLTSYEGLMKKLGIDTHEIYASTSDLKNKEVRDFYESGDETALRDRADQVAAISDNDSSADMYIPSPIVHTKGMSF